MWMLTHLCAEQAPANTRVSMPKELVSIILEVHSAIAFNVNTHSIRTLCVQYAELQNNSVDAMVVYQVRESLNFSKIARVMYTHSCFMISALSLASL